MRNSKINKIDRNELQHLVNNSNSLSELLLHFGLKNKGNNFLTLKNRLRKEEIDIQQLKDRSRKRMGLVNKNRIPNIELFKAESNKTRNIVKTRIIKEKLIPYLCKECGLSDNWKNKKLVLVLDHINGKPNDHRLENLRFLCPNCNSQTSTFAGRATKLSEEDRKKRITKNNRTKIRKNICKNCEDYCTTKSKSGLCRICYLSEERKCKLRKATEEVYPSELDLEKLVTDFGYSETGRRLGVSDNAVRKRLKKIHKHSSVGRASG